MHPVLLGGSDRNSRSTAGEDRGRRRSVPLLPGTFACLPAARGVDVIRVDPAAASLEVARRTRQAERVRELHGDSSVLGPLETDLATMTGHVG